MQRFRPANLHLPAWPLLLLAAVMTLGLGAAAATRPTLTTLGTLGLFVAAALITLRPLLPRLALVGLGICLLGYAMLGKGFSYLGVSPLYIGEMMLLLCLAATLLTVRLRVLTPMPLTWLLLLYMLLGLVATLPQISVYGIDALRDAVLWGYGLFALCLAALLLSRQWTLIVAQQYARLVLPFLIWTPFAVVAVQLYNGVMPRFPGTTITLIDVKTGDLSVHLAGIAVLLLLGLPRLLRPHSVMATTRMEWVYWSLWLASAAIPLFRTRAGLLSVVVALGLVVLLRPGSRWGKPAALIVLALTAVTAFNVQATVGEARNTISPEALILNLQSITGKSGESYRDGTRGWRLNWWSDIIGYTVHGPYFWTGKGYGINLADADGYQLTLEGSALRSPHNGHMSVLARSGVPGFVAWVILNLTFALGLLRAYFRANLAGQTLWAKLNLWVLAYWAAFMVNASFDVYLEGPQGGIWFWCLFGFGTALLELQRRNRATLTPRPHHTLPTFRSLP
ncbi:O-antigen ligase family protein [Deinococcus sp.]|uniref:O-antigen ligase family protein n=1 Tax=Deinococcus sp. TaxID=47478 RepID=UPI003B5A5EBF